MRIHERPAQPAEQERLDAQPPLDDASRLCIEAWHELATCRGAGFGTAGPIPITVVWQWCERRELEPDVADLVRRVVRRLDGDWLEARASEMQHKDPVR